MPTCWVQQPLLFRVGSTVGCSTSVCASQGARGYLSLVSHTATATQWLPNLSLSPGPSRIVSLFPLQPCERLESTRMEEQEPWIHSPVVPSTSDDSLFPLTCPVLLWNRSLFKVKAMLVSPDLFAHSLIAKGPWKTELCSPVSSPKSFCCVPLLRAHGCLSMSKVSSLGRWWGRTQIMPVATCPSHYRRVVSRMRFGTSKYCIPLPLHSPFLRCPSKVSLPWEEFLIALPAHWRAIKVSCVCTLHSMSSLTS